MQQCLQFIADIRGARVRELEEKRINKEMANIRKRFKGALPAVNGVRVLYHCSRQPRWKPGRIPEEEVSPCSMKVHELCFIISTGM